MPTDDPKTTSADWSYRAMLDAQGRYTKFEVNPEFIGGHTARLLQVLLNGQK